MYNKEEIVSKIKGLYVIIDSQLAADKDEIELSRQVLEGGASVIQLRDKSQNMNKLLEKAIRIKDLCEQYGAIFIVNDYPDIALGSEAHGVHVGQQDMPIDAVRRIIKQDQIIGNSNALSEEAIDSVKNGVDYLAVGAIFPTNTKQNTRPAGLETLKRVRTISTLPLVAIGGINIGNIKSVIEAGADAVCVVSAVIAQDDPESAARRLVKEFSFK
ncbi:MAG: thiamine phosphate synthase [SAR202 cluster bacterium]|nr:thiamine phosphate synthase [SAR202 cluster bacterium]|tara:strand:+ start:5771 stop:6415 length:645 start_codon:yes stop_codon:yes gene_type:complete